MSSEIYVTRREKPRNVAKCKYMKSEIADCKKIQRSHCQVSSFWKKISHVNWRETDSNNMPLSYECCFIGLESELDSESMTHTRIWQWKFPSQPVIAWRVLQRVCQELLSGPLLFLPVTHSALCLSFCVRSQNTGLWATTSTAAGAASVTSEGPWTTSEWRRL